MVPGWLRLNSRSARSTSARIAASSASPRSSADAAVSVVRVPSSSPSASCLTQTTTLDVRHIHAAADDVARKRTLSEVQRSAGGARPQPDAHGRTATRTWWRTWWRTPIDGN